AEVSCDSPTACNVCPDGIACGAPSHHHASPAVWLNKDRGQRWEYAPEFENRPALVGDINFLQYDSVADMDGDGRADLVRRQETVAPQPGVGLDILLNTSDQGWRAIPHIEINGISKLNLTDCNRDGLPDVIGESYSEYADGHLEANSAVFVNQGGSATSGLTFNGPIVHSSSGQGTPIVTFQSASLADLDGDGFHDPVIYYPLNDPS